MHLIAQRAPQDCGHERVVYCDGGHAALGHPRVFINLVCWFLHWQTVRIAKGFNILSNNIQFCRCWGVDSNAFLLGQTRSARLRILWQPLLQLQRYQRKRPWNSTLELLSDVLCRKIIGNKTLYFMEKNWCLRASPQVTRFAGSNRSIDSSKPRKLSTLKYFIEYND